jgi:hypothetical protein
MAKNFSKILGLCEICPLVSLLGKYHMLVHVLGIMLDTGGMIMNKRYMVFNFIKPVGIEGRRAK